MTTRSIYDCDLYLLRDQHGVVESIFRAHDPHSAEKRRPAGYTLELVYSSQNPAEIVVMQRAIGRWLSLPGRRASGNWPAHVSLPTRDDLLSAEARLNVDAGLERRAGRRTTGVSERRPAERSKISLSAANKEIRPDDAEDDDLSTSSGGNVDSDESTWDLYEARIAADRRRLRHAD